MFSLVNHLEHIRCLRYICTKVNILKTVRSNSNLPRKAMLVIGINLSGEYQAQREITYKWLTDQ